MTSLTHKDYSQRFSLKISTILLVFMLTFYVAGSFYSRLPDFLQRMITLLQHTIGMGAAFLWLPASLIALIYFIVSFTRGNPQFQFLIEILIGLGFAILIPSYSP